jgi:hypothetical protein
MILKIAEVVNKTHDHSISKREANKELLKLIGCHGQFSCNHDNWHLVCYHGTTYRECLECGEMIS